MKKWIWILVLSITCSTGCIIMTDGGDSSITIWNDSDYVIEYLYVSPSDSSHWGPDLLGGDVLYPNDEVTIHNLDCDYYDVMVVDEYDVECILDDEYLCFDDELWIITNITLDRCAYSRS